MLAKLRWLLWMMVCLGVGLGSAARAATLNVGPGQAYTTIQSAINAAQTGDTVLVAPGTYYENIDFKGKAIRVTSSGGAASTIIDGSNGQNPTVVFRNKESSTSVLNGFTVQGGGTEAYTVPPSNYGTGGILIEQGTPVISNNIITHNHCNAIQSNGSSPLIKGNEIDNTLDAKGGCGFAGGSAVWLFGSISNYNGGTQLTTPPAMVVGNTIQNNTQSGRDDAGGNGGAAVAIWGAYAVVTGNVLRNNMTLGDGGAILAFNTDNVVVNGNLIYGNQAGTDGAISLAPPGQSVGPFIGIVASNTIYGNSQTSKSGGFVGDVPPTQVSLSGDLGQYLVVNNIIVGAGPGSVAIACGTSYQYLTLVPPSFDHNDIYNSGGSAYGGSCPDQTGIYGNISADPVFTNPASGNFQLMLGSPAIDSGNSSAPMLTTLDVAGAPRVQDATGKGYPIVDVGALEASGSTVVSPTILTLTPSEYFYPPAYGYYNSKTPLLFTITLSSSAGIPAGPVTLYEDLKPLATVQVGPSGVATYPATNVTPGLHAYLATYPGSGIFPQAVSVKFYLYVPLYSETINITSSVNPSIFGSSVTFNVTATSSDGSIPSPIVVTDGFNGPTLSTLTPNSSGSASFSTSALSVGFHSVTATYAGDSTHASGSASVSQSVINGYATNTTLTCNPNTFYLNQTGLLNVAVSSGNGVPTGAVALTDNGASLGQYPLNNGTFGTIYIAQAVGTHTIVATYVPTGAFGGSSATCQIVVGLKPSTITEVSSLNPSNVRQGLIFTANVVYGGPPQSFTSLGSVTFSDGGTVLGVATLVATGAATSTASFSTNILAAGTHTITATLNPVAGYSGGAASVTQVVNKLPTTSVLTPPVTTAVYGTPVTLVAMVLPVTQPGPLTPVGTVTFSASGGVVVTVPLVGSVVAAALTLPAGVNQVTCHYGGDSVYLPSDCGPVTVTVTAAATVLTIASNANPAVALSPILFTVKLATGGQAAAGQGVNLTYNPTGTAPVVVPLVTDATGTASYTVSNLVPGSYAVGASFAGSANLLGSSASLTEIVMAIPTATVLTVAPNPGYQGQAVTLTATVTGFVGAAPALTVAFLDGASVIGNGTLNAGGVATLTTNALGLGTHPLRAAFPVGPLYLASTSAVVNEAILPSSFTLALSPTTLTLPPGQTGTATIQLGSVGQFAGPVVLTYGPLPEYATATISPSTVTLAAGGTASGTASSSITLATLLKSANEVPRRPGQRGLPVVAAAGLLIFARKRWRKAVLAGVLMVGLGGLSGCTNLWYEGHFVLAGTYQVVVTGTDANHNAQSAVLTVVVTP